MRIDHRNKAIAALDPDRVPELFGLVGQSRHPTAVRREAVDRLLAADPALFWQACARRARRIDDWPMVRLLADRAARSGNDAALPWLVRSWESPSLMVSDLDRPERTAIEAITASPASDWLWQTVLSPDPSGPMDERLAAWAVLNRVLTGEQVRAKVAAQLASSEPGDALLDSLQIALPALDIIPADREAVQRLLTLTCTANEQQWLTWARWRQQHRGDGPATLALRHLPAIERIHLSRAAWSRRDWLVHLSRRLADQPHAARGEQAGDAVVYARPERLVDHTRLLGVADLVVLDAIRDALDDQAVVQSLFKQADADLADTTTEFGGVLLWNDQQRCVAQGFEPLLRRHDQIYYASDACITAMHTGLAHYHFHAQRHDNATWAGPGKGDLGFADRMHASCVVLTFIDRDTLNADAYFPGGIIVDLGSISR